MNRLAVLLTFVLLGCTGPFVRVSAPPSAVPQEAGLTSGSACGMMILGLIPARMTDRTARAYEDAIHQAGSTGLTETTVTTHWYWAVVGTVHCVDVDGTATR